MLIQHGKPVNDSILLNIASNDNYRSQLLQKLEDIQRTDLFPSTFKKQSLVARSLLISNLKNKNLSDIKEEGKAFTNVDGKKGYVYFFLYKIDTDDEWKIGLSGLQPENLKDVSSNNILTEASNKKHG